eukprot:gnl/TRDRNA2_/TRDRNA2_174922_c0_seq1.p1 gnl/TRDRNA2_/TRDRNA2_174922_c0~~gnl/TRDRNA2_/TRDRNA2_174922_c0_seq1.p1  ORF type:complete len:189 (-),score=25.79 gnl/TRDRNA2_/TRDRNA2_174922_c0_seq1:305-871(-)
MQGAFRIGEANSASMFVLGRSKLAVGVCRTPSTEAESDPSEPNSSRTVSPREASDLINEPTKINWYAASDAEMQSPSFYWKKSPAQLAAMPTKLTHHTETSWSMSKVESEGNLEYDLTVVRAIRDIKGLLRSHGGDASSWILHRHWQQCFRGSLGPLRTFLEQHPDKFTVTPREGDQYTVSVKTKQHF